MTDAERDEFLAGERTCRVATVGPDGPHATPLWFAWDGSCLWLYSVVRSQRWTDLMRDPRVGVVVDAGAWMFEGSGFVNGEKVPEMVGNEYDRVTAGVPTPDDIQVIAHSPVDCKGLKSYADSTWYSAPSGAGVFSAGTFGWSPQLDIDCPPAPATEQRCKLAKVTENILRAFSDGPAGATHPSVSNLSTLGIRAAGSTKPPAD